MMCAPPQRLGRRHRWERPLVALRPLLVLVSLFGLASLLGLVAAPPALAQEDFSQVVLFAAANGQTKPCGYVTRLGGGGEPPLVNDVFSITSAPSTLYRVDPETGVATAVGPIQDPDLAGRQVTAGQTGTETSIDDFNIITLDASERLVDVCGLTPSADGRLLGTATLQNNRVHVLIEIDPDTGAAHLIDGLNIDLGYFNQGTINFENSADATVCLVSDLEFNSTQNRAIGIAQCFFTDKVSPRQKPLAGVQRTVVVRIDPDTAESVSAQQTGAFVPQLNNISFTPATLARRPSDGKLVGVLLTVFLHYNFDGSLDGEAQVANGLLDPDQTDVLGMTVAAHRAYWPIVTPDGQPRYLGTNLVNGTTSTTYSPGGQLYRAYLQGNLLAGQFTGISFLQKISEDDGTAVETAIPITEGGGSLLGVQAITFMPFATRDGTVSGGQPLGDILACPNNPRAASDCNIETFDPRSKIKYDAEGGRLYFKARRGNRKTMEDFGLPETVTTYAMCVYGGTNDEGSIPTLVGALQIPPSPIWDHSNNGFRYKNRDTQTRIRLILNHRHDVSLKFKSQHMPFPQQPTDGLGVTVQLITDEGECWHGAFPNGTFLENGTREFKAAGP